VDLRIAELKEQERQLSALLEASRAPLAAILKEVGDLTAMLETATRERRSLERDLDIHEAQMEKLRARLRELKTNKEYQAHLFEIEMANKKKAELEDRILVLMEKIQQQQQALADAQSRKAEAEARLAEQAAKIKAKQGLLAAELAELERRQMAIAATIEKGLLARYTKLRTTRGGRALAPVRNGVCLGCRLQLPPQLVTDVRRSEALLCCNHCQRILYWDGELARPVTARAWPDEPSAGSAGTGEVG
jgi:hypothetical protein